MTVTDVPELTRVASESRRAELRASLMVGLGAVALGALAGVAWGLLAPPQQLYVVSPGRGVPLTDESTHDFDALAIFLCLAGIVGAVSVLGAWQWRRMRGPILFSGTLVGTAVGGAVMWLIGDWVARLRHPKPDNPPTHHIIALAPSISVDLPLFAALFVAAFVLAVLVILSPRDDLGAADR